MRLRQAEHLRSKRETLREPVQEGSGKRKWLYFYDRDGKYHNPPQAYTANK